MIKSHNRNLFLIFLSNCHFTTRALITSNPTNPSPPWTNAALQAAEIISNAKSILFVTGAGISAESGLPTYRGVSGLYNQNDGYIDEYNMSIEDCLSGQTYRTNPEITWKYLLQIEKSCRGASPSRAHSLVAATERYINPVTVMTQNIDGLHSQAGSTDVINLHGTLYQLRCVNSSCESSHAVASYEAYETLPIYPPICKQCNQNTLKPNVVLFDEYLGDETVQKYETKLGGISMGELVSSWYLMGKPSMRRFSPYDVSVCIGTSALFGYVNGAALSGKRTIEINPVETSLSDLVDVHIRSGATEALEFIFDSLGWKD